jgi:hypothetical protein
LIISKISITFAPAKAPQSNRNVNQKRLFFGKITVLNYFKGLILPKNAFIPAQPTQYQWCKRLKNAKNGD